MKFKQKRCNDVLEVSFASLFYMLSAHQHYILWPPSVRRQAIR